MEESRRAIKRTDRPLIPSEGTLQRERERQIDADLGSFLGLKPELEQTKTPLEQPSISPDPSPVLANQALQTKRTPLVRKLKLYLTEEEEDILRRRRILMNSKSPKWLFREEDLLKALIHVLPHLEIDTEISSPADLPLAFSKAVMHAKTKR